MHFNISLPSDKENFSKKEVIELLKVAYDFHTSELKKQADTLENLKKQKTYWDNEHEKSLKLIVENSVQTIELEELNKKMQTTLQQLEIESKTDYLTKLLNRGALIEALQNEIKLISRTKEKVIKKIIELKEQEIENINIETVFSQTGDLGNLTTAIIDIDFFKNINDTYGHLMGDIVLKKIGEILRDSRTLRSTDISGRFGGEEFLIILPQTSMNNSLIPINKVFDTIKNTEFQVDAKRSFSITVSIGVAEYSNVDNSIENMIKRADLALYYAKEHGRNKIIQFDSSMLP